MSTTTASAAPATYTVGMTRYGKKVHRIYSGRTLCDPNDRIANLSGKSRNRLALYTDINVGEFPAGTLCAKCFQNVDGDSPRVEIVAPVATPAPVRKPAAERAPFVAPTMISHAEAFEMIDAAGCADHVGGRGWIIEGGKIDRAAIVAAIIEWTT